jgi:hypothetical protein
MRGKKRGNERDINDREKKESESAKREKSTLGQGDLVDEILES